jgi:hypothetical protein
MVFYAIYLTFLANYFQDNIIIVMACLLLFDKLKVVSYHSDTNAGKNSTISRDTPHHTTAKEEQIHTNKENQSKRKTTKSKVANRPTARRKT